MEHLLAGESECRPVRQYTQMSLFDHTPRRRSWMGARRERTASSPTRRRTSPRYPWLEESSTLLTLPPPGTEPQPRRLLQEEAEARGEPAGPLGSCIQDPDGGRGLHEGFRLPRLHLPQARRRLTHHITIYVCASIYACTSI